MSELVALTPDAAPTPARPLLIAFVSGRSGPCRRFTSHLAQVLQRNRNHETFKLVQVDVDARPDLVARFRIQHIPALVVVEDKRVRVRIDGYNGRTASLAHALQPWLHTGK